MKLTDKDAIYLKHDLDLLFVALNPPVQSNNNGHYFSGNNSTFFKQLYESGLIACNINKLIADEYIFGGSKYNYKNRKYGVIDLLPNNEETNSNKVKPKKENTELLIRRIVEFRPRLVCIIHSKVMDELKKYVGKELCYGNNGRYFVDSDAIVFCNYFPNGNAIPTAKKLEIYKQIRSLL